MSARFAERAGRLAGLAGAVAGWPPDTFWSATPAELAALLHALAGEDAAVAPPAPAALAALRARFPDG